MTATDPPTAALPVPVQTRLRASDADRAATVARLQYALGEGQLDLAETETRMTAAYAARYHTDLHPLLADLTEATRASTAAPSWRTIWTFLVWRARIVVFGPERAGASAPTARQCRTAVAIALLAALWFVACALLGAAAVA